MKSGELLRDLHIYFNDIKDLEKKEREIDSFISSLESFKLQVHNEKIGITDENLEEKIIEFLDNDYKYYLTKEENGWYKYSYEKQDYDDFIREENIKKILKGKTKEERQDIYYELFDEWGYQWEFDTIYEIASEFCNKYNYEQHDTEIQDILVNLIYFSYDTYLDDEYNVNIIIDFDKQDVNTDFSNSSNLENCKNNNLYTLLKKQGYSKKDYKENCKFLEDNKNEIMKDKYNYDFDKIEKLGGSKFLTSIKEEINNNQYDYLTSLVVLKKMTLEELINLDKITINTENEIGLFNWHYGSGSLLEIQLEKDFVLDREKDIYNIQVENCKQDFGYSVNEVYGLINSCWKE